MSPDDVRPGPRPGAPIDDAPHPEPEPAAALALARAKAALRVDLISRREALASEQAAALSAGIVQHLVRHLATALPEPACVALYASKGTEASLDLAWAPLRLRGHRLCLPRVAGRGQPLEFYVVDDPSSLPPGRFGLREPGPAMERRIPLDAIDLFVVPGLAFDAAGGRLGWGAGYYDRTLLVAHALRAARGLGPAPVVAVAYELQRVDRVPMGPDDVAVDYLITERGTRACARGSSDGGASPPSDAGFSGEAHADDAYEKPNKGSA